MLGDGFLRDQAEAMLRRQALFGQKQQAPFVPRHPLAQFASSLPTIPRDLRNGIAWIEEKFNEKAKRVEQDPYSNNTVIVFESGKRLNVPAAELASIIDVNTEDKLNCIDQFVENLKEEEYKEKHKDSVRKVYWHRYIKKKGDD